METMIYKKDRVTVLESGPVFSKIVLEGKEDHTAYSVKTAELRPVKTRRQSATEKALSQDPEILNALVPFVQRIEVSSSPNGLENVTEAVASSMGIPVIDSYSFVKAVSEKSHAGKFDVLVSANISDGLQQRLGLFFDKAGHRAKNGELQINSRSLALWLMNYGGISPVKWST